MSGRGGADGDKGRGGKDMWGFGGDKGWNVGALVLGGVGLPSQM